MALTETEDISKEIERSLAVEHMTMTEDEKENPRKVGYDELPYYDPVSQYVAAMKQSASHGKKDI